MFKSKRLKKLSAILIWLIIIVATIHIALFAFLNVSGKGMIIKYVKSSLSADAELDSVSFTFPFTVVIKDFKCKDLSFSRADISLLWFNPFNSHVFLNWVYIDDLKLKVNIAKDKISIDPIFVKEIKNVQDGALSVAPAATATNEAGASEKSKAKIIRITTRKLSIRKASVEVADLTKEAPVIFVLKNVNLQLGHFVYPSLSKFYVSMDALLTKKDLTADNTITMKGWVDYPHRNMSVKLKVNGADYLLFAEYYPPFWKPDSLGVKDAKLSLDTTMNSLNNDLIIEAVLSLDNIEFVENPQDSSRTNTIRTMIALFKGDNEKPILPIKLKTKMDSFNIDFSSLQDAFKGKMKFDIGTIVFNILDKAKSKVTGTTGDIKAVTVDKTKEAMGTVKDVTVDKTVETIKGVVGTIESVIKSQKEEKAQELQPQVEQPAEDGAEVGPQSGIKPEENIQAPTEPAEQNINQNGTESAPLNTESQTQAQPVSPEAQGQNITQSIEMNTQNQNVIQSAPPETQNQNQTQSAQ